MKKAILFFPYCMLYILYVLLTLKERNEYMLSQQYGGKKVSNFNLDSGLVTSKASYKVDKSQKHVRGYMTFDEFWTQKGYM